MLQACGGSGDSNNNTSITCQLGSDPNVTVSGTVTFDRVPLSASGRLDFDNTTQQPVRGAVIEAICNGVLVSSTTDEVNGNYSLSIPGNTNGVFIRVRAQILRSGAPSWDVVVIDESQAGEFIFVLDGGTFNVGLSNSTRNLNADSGFGGVSYTSARAAAPFAILDTIFESMQRVLAENSTAQFPALNARWSPDSVEGTFFSNNTITILGRASADTDEFDEHVIAHEWGHYFQDAFSRDDSVGGPHGEGDILDIRVAFSEGFGNAFSAIVTADTLYRDSQGLSSGFNFNVESGTCINAGWFSECSVHQTMYDIFDANNDGADTLSLGFTPIFNAMTTDVPDTLAVTSLFSFINPIKNTNTGDAASIDNLLLAEHGISAITDDEGTGRTLNPGSTDQLPLFESNFPIPSLCVTGENFGFNGLGTRRFVQFTVPNTGQYTYRATRVSGLLGSDPDLFISFDGQEVGSAVTAAVNIETLSVNLIAGRVYILELLEFIYSTPNYNPNAVFAINETCFDLTQTQN